MVDEPEDQPAWVARPGEPALRITTVEETRAIVLQIQTANTTTVLAMRPEVAEWLGERLGESGRLMKMGIIIPTNGQVPPEPKGGD